MDKVLEDIRSFITCRVRAGFESVHDIVENATNYALETHGNNNLQPSIKRLVAESLAAHRAEQSGWEFSTDCDRLDEAFGALNRQGIVARQDFACCNNCGFTEIWDEVEEEEKHHPVEGYVFYNMQLTERAIETGQLLLAYGCIDEEEVAFVRVTDKIIVELRRVGLDVKWQGTAGHPIIVEGFVWQKRRN